MGKGIEEIKELLLDIFPKLAQDKNFKITSKSSDDYNCIAWAYNIDDKWMWPNTGQNFFLDGVHYWPSDEILDCDVSHFIKAFELHGYRVCEFCNFDPQYRKIVLYVKDNSTECTHAAREKENGFWTSKLGRSVDIQHETPYTIESNYYGKVFCFMKKGI
jgi:hypothetical protein